MNDLASVSVPSVEETLREALPGASLEAAAALDMELLYVEAAAIVDVCRTLRDHPLLQFALLAELTAVDAWPASPRFEIVYHLACLGQAFAQAGAVAPVRRLRLKVRLDGDHARLPSVTSVFPAAGWPEREVFDLFGIVFEGHEDLRRILMADDWEGHPLRKDYPVQIRKETSSWSALQMTAAEFAATIQAARDRAASESRQTAEGTRPK